MNAASASGLGVELVVASLEAVAELDVDIVPLVYERLFATRPDLRQLFALEQPGAIRSGMGNMVNEVLRLVLAESQHELETEAQAAVVFHVGWGLEIDMYRDVVRSVRDAVHAGCGDRWTPAIDVAWNERLEAVLAELRRQHLAIEGPTRH